MAAIFVCIPNSNITSDLRLINMLREGGMDGWRDLGGGGVCGVARGTLKKPFGLSPSAILFMNEIASPLPLTPVTF